MDAGGLSTSVVDNSAASTAERTACATLIVTGTFIAVKRRGGARRRPVARRGVPNEPPPALPRGGVLAAR